MKVEITIVTHIGGETKAIEEYELNMSQAVQDDLRRWIRWAQKYGQEELDGG